MLKEIFKGILLLVIISIGLFAGIMRGQDDVSRPVYWVCTILYALIVVFPLCTAWYNVITDTLDEK